MPVSVSPGLQVGVPPLTLAYGKIPCAEALVTTGPMPGGAVPARTGQSGSAWVKSARNAV